MTHPEWCGEDCAICTKQCGLDDSMPCSPNCCNFTAEGDVDPLLCEGCDVFNMHYREVEDLDKETLLKLVNSYDNYIQANADYNPEFGHSWFPVCISEYLKNEFLEDDNE